ncbi:MAG: hypothetical protein M3N53_08625 [Actinomycetota bacterium]|nr:hypothetical protein [Actinomycetota bacterium]
MTLSRRLRIALAALILLGGLIHLQQFLDGFSSIPIIGPMFLANAVASAVVAALLVWRSERLWIIAGGLVATGSLAAILISRGPGLFGYVSSSFEAPEALAVVSEAAAFLLATFILVKRSRLTPAS